MFQVDTAKIIVNDIYDPNDSKYAESYITEPNYCDMAQKKKKQFRKNDNNYKVSLMPSTTYEWQWLGEQEARVSAATRALVHYKAIVLLV